MRRRTRRIALGVLLLPVVLLSLYAAAEPKTLRSHLVGFSDMRGEGEQLYVDPAWDTSTVRELERALVEARMRVELLFGTPARARPVVIAADSPESILRFMGNLHGATHATPLATIIVLGPEGVSSIDVIAHELVHAEHVKRSGWLRYTLAPMWFIEGLGMQVDHRSDYDDAAWVERTGNGARAPALDDLAQASGFISGDVPANYAHARREVSRWLSAAGPGALAELLTAGCFDQRYAAHQTVGRKATGGTAPR